MSRYLIRSSLTVIMLPGPKGDIPGSDHMTIAIATLARVILNIVYSIRLTLTQFHLLFGQTVKESNGVGNYPRNYPPSRATRCRR